ncbi:hypothetical protein SAMN05421878_10467 [Actinobaculum suis]|uniref:Uncharacterized protein n=1 Tax=Actinobaculum suis TaxID=1657 RepID=A0A0K9ESE6_9ACTO|nr:hypothetical protein [Actinobaculum suis]KMY22796.1 hypothetical protein ACU19_08040 [Actinobaculum suis]MDY5153622.1 hypothetical protein [Actinobaculum suis]OCA93125.1 hypothetical protein ACU21_01355 [Actinobaculum suis]OCA93233.1 hypothetical protein ACU20_02435 [Actinobaculum suis]SDE23394.1 hypothetical protein SAMN05421878_10467 [Actinobaculum suis]
MPANSSLHLPRRARPHWVSPGPDPAQLAAAERAAEAAAQQRRLRHVQAGGQAYPRDVVVVHGDPEETSAQLKAAGEGLLGLRPSDERRPPFPRRPRRI